MKENGFEYVDLGFPSCTMWATCNVGATKPEDYGLLFQFGRVDGYKYGDTNHKFITNEQNKKDTGNEEIPVASSSKTYDKNDILDLKDDAVYINMGGKWRMPTNDQIKELLSNTIREIKTINGVQGMMLTSIINGHQLYIPFSGYWYSDFYCVGSGAYIWTSQVHGFGTFLAYALYCYSYGVAEVNFNTRAVALSVRGVFKK